MKKSNKMIAAAAAGALLLTGGVTAVANAVSPAAAPAAAPVKVAADVLPAPENVVAQNRISVGGRPARPSMPPSQSARPTSCRS